MRVALLAQEISPSYTGGGIGTYTMALAAGLRDLGADVVVVGRHDGPPTRVEGVAYMPRVHVRHRRLPMLADRVEAVVEARRALRALGRFDVVEGPDWLAEGLLAPRGAVRARHVHGSNRVLRAWAGRHASLDEKLVDALEHWDLSKADVVTAASRLSTTLPDGRVLFPAAVLVPMPVRLDGWLTTQVARTPRAVALVGRIDPGKGGDVLIRAAHRLGGVTVRLVGRDQPYPGGPSYLAALSALASELRVELDVVGATGPDGVARALAVSRAVAVPSRFDSFSLVALEGLAARRPVVLSDRTGAAESLPTPVFPSEDDAALAEALRPFLDDPAVATDAAERGRTYVEEHHAPRHTAQAKLAAWAQTGRTTL